MTKTRERPRLTLEFPQPSLAKQSFKAECDINTIMAKYRASGLIDHVNKYGGRYDDLPDETDYQSNIESVRAAEEAFASLPSKIREQFKNDPARFLAFVLNPDNKEEIRKLGLGDEQPIPAEPVPAPATGEGETTLAE